MTHPDQTPQDLHAERQRFEQWAAQRLAPAGRDHPWFERNSQGDYVFGDMPAWWEGWQAHVAEGPEASAARARQKKRQRIEDALEYAGSWAAFGLLLAAVFAVFLLAHSLMAAFGLTTTRWQSLAVWVAVGLPCAWFWPVRYRKGMQGHWRKYIPHSVLLSLTGPLALLLGYPL